MGAQQGKRLGLPGEEAAGVLDALYLLRDRLLEFDTIDEIRQPGLSERRRPVIIGGAVMLQACFKALEIDMLKVSPYALREGVLQDLLGRLDHQDPSPPEH